MTAPQLMLRLLGVLAAVAAADPTAAPASTHVTLAVLGALVACFAAAPVVARPVSRDFRWRAMLRRHRATAFGTLLLVLCATSRPQWWWAALDALLFTAWLLAAEAMAGGPPARRLLRSGAGLTTVLLACAAVLTAALLPVTPAPSWGRLLAALMITAAALGLAAFWLLQQRPQGREELRE